MLKPTVLESHEAISHHVSDLMVEQVRQKPDSLICLASGGTPTRAYELFVEKLLVSPVSVAKLRMIKLDEWGGLAMDDPASCEHHLRATVINPLSLQDRYLAFNNEVHDPSSECERIASYLSANGPIDLCILGLGVNGHLGFNEPGDYLQPHAHVAKLSPASLGHAMLGATRSRPTCGLTLGMAELLSSREVVLLVSGPAKREAMRRLLSGKIETHFPATFLSLHLHVHLICDRESMS